MSLQTEVMISSSIAFSGASWISLNLACSWLAISEDNYELLGQGETPEEAMEQSRKKGFEDPVLTRVPADWHPRILCCE